MIDTKCSPSIKTLHWNIFFNCQVSYWLIPINLPLKKFFSCFRIQRELHLFIAAMIHTETVLCTIIQAKIFVHWLIVTVNLLWWRFSWGQTPNFYGPSSTDLFTFLSTSAMVKKQLLIIKNNIINMVFELTPSTLAAIISYLLWLLTSKLLVMLLGFSKLLAITFWPV